MAEHAALAGLLAEFGRTTGLGLLPFGEEGLCAIAFDEGIVLHVAAEPDDRGLLFLALSPAVREIRQLATYRRLLEANARAGGPPGACFALDPRDGVPLLCCPVLAGRASYPEFETLVLWCVETAEAWSAELAAAAEPAAPEPFMPQHGLGGMIRG